MEEFQEIKPNIFKQISDKGSLFTTLFYILFAIILLDLIVGLIIFTQSITQISYIFLLGMLIFVILLILLFILKKLHSILVLLTIPLLLWLQSLPLIQSYIGFYSDTGVYTTIIILCLIIGIITAYLFNKVDQNINKYITTSIVFTSLIGIVFAVNHMIIEIITTLSRQLTAIQLVGQPTGQVDYSNLFSNFLPEVLFDTSVGFILAFICFAGPFILFQIKKEGFQIKHLLWYFLPIAIFLVFYFILGSLANSIVGSY